MFEVKRAVFQWQMCIVAFIVAAMGVLNTAAFADSSLSSLTLRAGLDRATYSNGSDPILTLSVVNNGPAVTVDWTHMLIMDFLACIRRMRSRNRCWMKSDFAIIDK